MTAQTDAELVRACLEERSPAAFTALVARDQSVVCAVCYAAMRGRARADELAQETFLIAWRRLGELRDTARVGPWLAAIARNVGRNARRRFREVPIEDVDVHAATARTPVDDVLARESERAVRDALERMPVAYREALILFYWEG